MNRPGRDEGRGRRPIPDRKRAPPGTMDRRSSNTRSPPRRYDTFTKRAAHVQVVILGTKQRRYGDQCAESIRGAGFWVETRFLEGQRLREVIGQAEQESSSYLVIVGVDNEQDKNVSFKILDSNQPPISRVSIKKAIDLIIEHDCSRNRTLRFVGESPPIVTHRLFSPPNDQHHPSPDRRRPSPPRRPVRPQSPPPRRFRSRSPPYRVPAHLSHHPSERPVDLRSHLAPRFRDSPVYQQRPPMHYVDPPRGYISRARTDVSPHSSKPQYSRPSYETTQPYEYRSSPREFNSRALPSDPESPLSRRPLPYERRSMAPPHSSSSTALDAAAVSDLLRTLDDIDGNQGPVAPNTIPARSFEPTYNNGYDMPPRQQYRR
uniref:Anticodon-binding domain-containing protein n=1 Tax=Spongospora subterranea TaxID=70186 RepID=A0A0H5R484_9EUKA|eukprot:CRZ08652.1 hypothetical protein [Spongospora subterranea]